MAATNKSKEKSVHLTIRVSIGERKALREVAKANGMSLSAYVLSAAGIAGQLDARGVARPLAAGGGK